VKNQGSQGTSTSFNVGIYLSSDTKITTSDDRIGSQSVFGGLAAGASKSQNTDVTVPNSLNSGIYWIGAIADYDGRVSESNGANNALAGNCIKIGYTSKRCP